MKVGLAALQLKLRGYQELADLEQQDAKRLLSQTEILKREKHIISIQHKSDKLQASETISKLTQKVNHLTFTLQHVNEDNNQLRSRIKKLEFILAQKPMYSEKDMKTLYELEDQIQCILLSVDDLHNKAKLSTNHISDVPRVIPVAKPKALVHSHQNLEQYKLPIRTRKNQSNLNTSINKRTYSSASLHDIQAVKAQQQEIWNDIVSKAKRQRTCSVDDCDDATIPYSDL